MACRSIVLRLRTREGHSRIAVPAGASLACVQERVAEQLQVPQDKLEIFLDQEHAQRLPPSTHVTLASAGLANGTMLFVRTADATPKISAGSLPRAAHMTTADLPPETKPKENAGASSSASSSPAPRSAQPTAGGASAGSSGESAVAGVNFKAFDAFLRERKFAVNDLPGCTSYKPRVLEAGRMNKIPATVTLKHQVYRHVDHLEMMNVDEVKNFVQFWQQDLQMLQQRFGYMFGYYVEDPHYPDGIRAVCEAIYEPPQDNSLMSIDVKKDDEEIKIAEKIAERLGLEPIGCIFTHAPREELLTADEVVDLAKMQLERQFHTHYTGYPMSKYVCCTVSLDKSTRDGEAVPNAFMVSDMGTALVRDGVICDRQPDDTHIQLRAPAKGELLPQILESGRETTKFDASWFIVRVNESAPRKVRSFFCSSSFPRANRLVHQTPRDITDHLNRAAALAGTGAHAKKENWKRFADFHLLLYVARLFDLDTAFSICDCVRNRETVDEGLEDTLKSLG
ncbi:NPL4 family protein [Besnoitia besnoiti]|uniref:NPL4 family protein n=1 Tax=Besnoitia besnoiti TaxID=94643 RepID=A0A2A9MMH1_BESBE|nr:NPL4 family protein [Besnoitia besnoiti]PFH37306.1 NPL4 family protein [Besnoitia besnoiti]